MRNTTLQTAIFALLILSGGAVSQVIGNSPVTPDSASVTPINAKEADNKPSVAVYVAGDVPEYQKEFLGTYLLTSFINSGTELNDETAASFLAAVDEELAKRKTPLNDSLICELGRKFGIRYICLASITPRPDSLFTFSARIISAKTGKSRFNSETTGPLNTMEDLESASGAIVEKIFGGTAGLGGQPTRDPKSAQPVQTQPPRYEPAPAPQPLSGTETRSGRSQDTAGTAAKSKPAVAAYVAGGVPAYQRDFVGTYLLNALPSYGAYINDETAAAFLAAVNEERSKRKNAAAEDSMICESARKTGVKYVCAISITPAAPDSDFTLSGRVISVKTGKSGFHGKASGAAITMGNLAKTADTLLEKMFDGKPVFSSLPPTDATADNKAAERLDSALWSQSLSQAQPSQHEPASALSELSPDSAETAAADNDGSAAIDTISASASAPDTAAKTPPTTLPETEETPKIAVYVAGDVPENDKAALGTRMLAAFVNSGRYRGVERSAQFLAELEKEHIKQRSGDVDDSQLSALGKQFGVNIICVATITPTLGSYQVSARIIDVETAEVTHIGEANSPLKTLEDLTIVSSEVVSNMFGRQLSISSGQQKQPKTKYSIGVGAVYVGNFGGGIAWGNGQVAMPYIGGGVYLFASHTYVSAHITYLSGGGRWESDHKYNPHYELPDMPRIDINIGVLGKYPISVLENITVLPIAGLDYNICASAKLVRADGSRYAFDGINGHPSIGDLNELWVRFGAGVDVNIGWNIYVCGKLLYGARLANAFEQSYLYDNGYTKLAHGLTLTVGAGLRL